MKTTNKINLMFGDNMELLKKLEDNSVDSIVTDPPYGLSFMNKKWDYDVPSVDFWKEALRVLKPGGHVLSFGGTRTYHRMVVNMEDAGFEIRDQIQWIYGSGFPKSLNIGKAFDKKEGNEREVVEVKDLGYKDKDTSPYSVDAGYNNNSLRGLGTGLKPANEPIVVARKPLSEKTIVDNVIKWGTGGINIDGCRIGTEKIKSPQHNTKDFVSVRTSGNYKNTYNGTINEIEGRWPANIIFDEDAATVLDEQSGITFSVKTNPNTKRNNDIKDSHTPFGKLGNDKAWLNCYDDKGGASRFFYVAKVSKKERNLGLDEIEKNNHPTLKPINLMTYLCRLVTPQGGTVLDPFMGSGSCGIAACLEGFSYIGMELDENYYNIAKARVNNYEAYRKLLK